MAGFKSRSGSELAVERKKAAQKFSAIGEMIAAEAGVKEIVPRNSLTGSAWVREKKISAPYPTTTRKRLYILAHECAHIVLHERTAGGYRRKPAYVQEYEAEIWAISKLREHGVAVPKDMIERAKRYVGRKINQAVKRGAKNICPKIRAWSEISKR